MSQLRISYIQADLFWEDIEKNLDKIENLIQKLPESDLIVLPEMFATAFTMQPEKMAQNPDGSMVQWLHKQAKQTNAVVAGSLAIRENNQFFNRFVAATPSGEAHTYNKHHLFRMGNEHLHYTPGKTNQIFSLNNWRIKPLVCYDLRFPVWARNQNDYDMLLYVANWPARRREHWLTLLRARAIENQAFVVGVNRYGADGNNTFHAGDSCIFAPDGTRLDPESHLLADYSHSLTIDLEQVNQLRASFPVWQDADDFRIL